MTPLGIEEEMRTKDGRKQYEVPPDEHRGHKFSTHGTNGRAGTGEYGCKLLKNLVGRVGVEPTAR